MVILNSCRPNSYQSTTSHRKHTTSLLNYADFDKSNKTRVATKQPTRTSSDPPPPHQPQCYEEIKTKLER